jgi:hypothetical protein
MIHAFLLPASRCAAALGALLLCAVALAAPGAHGPNGEHLDGPAQAGTTSAAPRLEAKSELFELVATLSGGELSILVDRYETNEPVLAGRVEVESGPLKAVAKFHADHGDYAVDDPKLLAALAKPGEHPLVFTVAAGEHTDLLDGTLRVLPAQDDHAHAQDLFTPGRIAAAAAVLLAIAAAVVAMRRRRRLQGGVR